MNVAVTSRNSSSGRTGWAGCARVRRQFLGPVGIVIISAVVALQMTGFAVLLGTRIDLSFPEGAVVARAANVAAGRSPYHEWKAWPHPFAPYGPLTYYGVGWAARALNVGDSIRAVYLVGRLQSSLAFLGIAVLMGVLLRREQAPWPWWVLSWLVVLTWEWLMVFILSYRPDAPAVFFSLLSLTVAMHGSPTARRVALAFGALGVAMGFKPLFWATTLVLGVWVGRARGPRTALLAVGAFAAAGLLPAILLNTYLGGMLFHNMLGSMNNGIDLLNPSHSFNRLPAPHKLVLVAGVLISAIRWRHRAKQGRGLLELALLASIPFTALQTLKPGSNANYYLEPLVLASLVTLRELAGWWGTTRNGKPIWREALLGGIGVALIIYLVPIARSSLEVILSPGRVWGEPPVVSRVARSQGPVLCTNPFLALAHPEAPGILDCVQYKILVERGLLEDRPLLERLERKEIALIVIPEEALASDPSGDGTDSIFCRGFLPTLLANYQVVDHQAFFVLLAPAPASSPRPPPVAAQPSPGIGPNATENPIGTPSGGYDK